MSNKKPKRPLKKYAILIGAGLQMGITIYLFAYLGKWLDANYNNDERLYVIICTLFGVAGSMWVLVRQLKNLHD